MEPNGPQAVVTQGPTADAGRGVSGKGPVVPPGGGDRGWGMKAMSSLLTPRNGH
jgi:hypothetical protein